MTTTEPTTSSRFAAGTTSSSRSPRRASPRSVAHRPGDGEVRRLRGDAPAGALRGRAQRPARARSTLAANHGWTPEREHDGGPVIALMRERRVGHARAGRAARALRRAWPRTSTRCAPSSARTCARSRRISQALGIRWLGLGFHPFARREDFEWVPKQRYGVMREYLPTRGGHALDMMLRTCTVQVNLDYESEADAMRKMRVALALVARHDGDVREQPVEGGAAARRPDLPRARVARRRSRSLGPLSRRCGSSGAGSTTTSSGRSTSRCSSSSGTATRSPTPGRPSARFLEERLRGPAADDGRLEDAPQHALPRGAPQEDDRECAAPTCSRRTWRARFPRCGRASSTTTARSPRPRRSSRGGRHDEVAELRTRAWRDGLRAPFRGGPLVEVAAAHGRDRRRRARAARRGRRGVRQGRARAPGAAAQAGRRGPLPGRRAPRRSRPRGGSGGTSIERAR